MLGPLMLGIEGHTLLGEERARLRHPAVGGVLLFTRNYENPQQLAALVAEIRSLRDPALLIAVDQEGGRVQRFREGFTTLPPAQALGRAWESAPALALDAAHQIGWLMARELRAVGVDFSFAPVLDIDRGISKVIGDRAFAAQPETIARLAIAWQRGAREAGMVSIGKHFPGHGGVAPDSHHASATDHRQLADLYHTDLLPFRHLIDNGLAGVMMAHLVFSDVDSKPVGFSDKWISYLRNHLAFSGAVFTDDLDMAAAAAVGDLSQRIRLSLKAGCDMAVVGNAGRAIDSVLDQLPTPDTLSALRLARLHGRNAVTPDDLVDDPRVISARALVADLMGQGYT